MEVFSFVVFMPLLHKQRWRNWSPRPQLTGKHNNMIRNNIKNINNNTSNNNNCHQYSAGLLQLVVLLA